jgi:AcrR family transcriptional regulator
VVETTQNGAVRAKGSGRGRLGTLSRRELHERVWSKPLTAVAEDFGISRNGLAKICDRLMIPYPGRGYWTTAQQREPAAPPPLPAAPANAAAELVIAAGRTKARSSRTRLTPEARHDQLVEAAGVIAAAEGVHAVTTKRVAREVGISEAQAHNYFSRRADLLVALARRELAAMNAVRESEVERGHDNLTRVTLSTIAYLRQVSQRGALIQALLNLPEVRVGLRAERQAQALFSRRRVTDRLNVRYGVAEDMAYGATVVLTAVCLRAGRLLAERKIPLDMAERLSLAIVTAGNRGITRAARETQPVSPPRG